MIPGAGYSTTLGTPYNDPYAAPHRVPTSPPWNSSRQYDDDRYGSRSRSSSVDPHQDYEQSHATRQTSNPVEGIDFTLLQEIVKAGKIPGFVLIYMFTLGEFLDRNSMIWREYCRVDLGKFIPSNPTSVHQCP